MITLTRPKSTCAAKSTLPEGLRFALADLADSLVVGVSSAIVTKTKTQPATPAVIRKTVRDLLPTLLENEFLRRLVNNEQGAQKQRAVIIHVLSSVDAGVIHSSRASETEVPGIEEIFTSEQASELLHVSRTHVNMLLDSGALGPVTRTAGNHRRISKAAVLAYKEEAKNRQSRGLDAMMQATERMGLYDAELEGVSRRSKR